MARAGFAARGPVRDGRQPALGARQRLLHRLRQRQARRLLRHPAGAPGAGEVEAVLAHELGHFKLRHIRKRMVAMAAITLAFFALLGWLVDAGLVLHRPRRHAEPDAAERRARALLFLLVALGVRRLRVAALRRLVAPRRVRGRRLRLRARRRPRPGLGAAQAARGQRLDADARPAVRALLLFASAGGRAPRRARRPAARSRSHHDRLPRAEVPGAQQRDERSRDPRPPRPDERLARRRRRDREDVRLQGLARDGGLRRRARVDVPRRGPPPRPGRHASTAAWCASRPIRPAASR